MHHIGPEEGDGEGLTCIAWNHASDNYMFATGSHEGNVRLWQAHPGGTRNSLIEHDPVLSIVDTSTPGLITAEPERIMDSPGGILRSTLEALNAIDAEIKDDDGYFGEDAAGAGPHRGPERKRTISFSDPLPRPSDDDN